MRPRDLTPRTLHRQAIEEGWTRVGSATGLQTRIDEFDSAMHSPCGKRRRSARGSRPSGSSEPASEARRAQDDGRCPRNAGRPLRSNDCDRFRHRSTFHEYRLRCGRTTGFQVAHLPRPERRRRCLVRFHRQRRRKTTTAVQGPLHEPRFSSRHDREWDLASGKLHAKRIWGAKVSQNAAEADQPIAGVLQDPNRWNARRDAQNLNGCMEPGLDEPRRGRQRPQSMRSHHANGRSWPLRTALSTGQRTRLATRSSQPHAH